MKRKLFSSALAILGLLGLTQVAAAQVPAASCGAPCPCPCQEKVCQRITEKKTVETTCYDDVCEDYCYARCSLMGLLHGGCGSCEDGKCSHLRTKKYLVIRVHKHDECVSKCVPVVVEPSCPAPCYTPAPMMAPPPAPKVGYLMPGTVQAQQWPR
jgi:hypothetical protein